MLRTSSNISIKLYADDVKIYGTYDFNDSTEVRSALQKSIENLYHWATMMGIPINLQKCAVMRMGSRETPLYDINGTILKHCNSIRDLGIIIDDSLRFSSQVDTVVRKAYSSLFSILRNVKCSDEGILLRLYKLYVLPHLEYCSPVWSPHLRKDVNKIARVQQVFTRLLWYRLTPTSDRKNIPSYPQRLLNFRLKTLEERRASLDLTFSFRILRRELNLMPSKYWVFRPSSARTGGFNIHYLKVHRKRYAMMFNNVFIRSARWFQLLPPEVFQVTNSRAFRSKLDKLNLLRMLL